MSFSFPVLTAAEAAAMIQHGQTVGFSGFTPAGAPKSIPRALAERAEDEHTANREFQIGVLTGASTGDSLDGALARAGAISFRTPYQSNSNLRASINQGQTRFFDMHLSMMPQAMRYGFLGPVIGPSSKPATSRPAAASFSPRRGRGPPSATSGKILDRAKSTPSPDYAARNARHLRACRSAQPAGNPHLLAVGPHWLPGHQG